MSRIIEPGMILLCVGENEWYSTETGIDVDGPEYLQECTVRKTAVVELPEGSIVAVVWFEEFEGDDLEDSFIIEDFIVKDYEGGI